VTPLISKNGLRAVFFVSASRGIEQETEMGRRALPKLDNAIDLSHVLTEVSRFNAPWDPQSLFAQPRELEIEVGSGKGLFMLAQSGRSPERNFLGNEIAMKYCRLAAYRLATHDRVNAVMLSGDGMKLFRELLPAECAAAVHVYFPDPWWKARHRRRRIINPGFIHDLERVLKPAGIFHFWTDVEEYFDEACGLIQQESRLTGPHAVAESIAEHDMDYRTHFERRMRKNQHPVFRSQFIKP
jgi:tRNA (guanine-N7-)-methyltransferase